MYHRHPWEASVDAVCAAVLSEREPGHIWLETGSRDAFGTYAWMAAGKPLRFHRPPNSSGAATQDDWDRLVAAWRHQPTWWFGILSYDLKSVFEPSVPTPSARRAQEPDFLFFEPSWVAYATHEGETFLEIHPDWSKSEFDAWWSTAARNPSEIHGDVDPALSGGATEATPRETYLQAAESLLNAMQRGDLYEANLCLSWTLEAQPNPADLYRRWSAGALPPQGGCAHFPEISVVCGSPERYLQVRDARVLSRPIKGTAPRSADPIRDAENAQKLAESRKERAENTMVVDVVRNDLSRVSVPGSVSVPEWCVIESFPTVHQMVSTVEGRLAPGRDVWDAVAASFPMASMTGAPKIEAMRRIDAAENFTRGWYSGALGYVQPNGDADFNVIIRSALVGKQVRLAAGSALTLAAEPAAEWEECLLKVQPLMDRVLHG